MQVLFHISILLPIYVDEGLGVILEHMFLERRVKKTVRSLVEKNYLNPRTLYLLQKIILTTQHHYQVQKLLQDGSPYILEQL